MPDHVSKEEVIRKLQLDYRYSPDDHTSRVLDALMAWLASYGKNRNLSALLQEAASLVSKYFRIREVAIGLRGKDGLYRIEECTGYRPEAEAAYRKIAYTTADFEESSVYKGVSISSLTKAYLSEDSPYAGSEENTYSRPMMLGGNRKSLDESMEGDYFDIKIRDLDGSLLGWIEISGTTSWKLPDAQSIKWIEIVASILAQLLSGTSGASGR